ncbi:Carboxy-terminal domain (CTD) phosphatase, partial [Modicella reniformis]
SNTPSATPPANLDEANKASKPKTPVAEDTDNELKHILEILETIHERFYDTREQFMQGESWKEADVKIIIQDMKKSVLRGVNILFSSVIPLGQNPKVADIWQQAQSFGAECSHELGSKVTHVVAAKPGTAKVIKAKQRKNVKIVRPEWLYHSTGKWQRLDESQYLLLEPPGKTTPISTTPPPPPATDGEEETGADEEDQGGISEGMDENHRPMSINKEEINEHLKSVNWDDMGKEVEDFVGDLDDTDFDSDTSTHSNTQSDASTDTNRSPLVNLKRARIPRKSGLGGTVTYGGSDSEDDNDSTMEGLMMDQMESVDRQMGSDESDGDIDEESGSDGDGDLERDAGRPPRATKRRRLNAEKAKGSSQFGARDADADADADDADADIEEDMYADDQITMNRTGSYVNSRRRVAKGGEGNEEDDDDDDFLNTLENDIDAQLNEDED